MLAVICFWWSGDRWQNKDEGKKYIQILRNAVRRNLCCDYAGKGPIPYEFICFSNELKSDDVGVEIRPFKMPVKKGVMPRVYMFSEEAGLYGKQVLALDLDVIVTGPLHDFATYETLFCSRSKFAKGQEWKLDGDVTSFKACEENTERFWKPLVDNPQKVLEISTGRERYWFRHVIGVRGGDRWDKVLPGQLVSYKRHVKPKGVLDPDVRIVSCHGKPRPQQLINRHKWAKENWR